jgi:hypothetical protein
MMPPHRCPKLLTDFLGMQLRQSGDYAAEITVDVVRWWLGTFVFL